MQTVETYFNDTIEKYRQLKQTADLLIQSIPLLSPIEIENRCNELHLVQKEIYKDHSRLCLIMEGIGPEILNTSYIGEYQRAMDRAILACDTLQAELCFYQDRTYDLPCTPLVAKPQCQVVAV